jgi:hypothetical protein
MLNFRAQGVHPGAFPKVFCCPFQMGVDDAWLSAIAGVFSLLQVKYVEPHSAFMAIDNGVCVLYNKHNKTMQTTVQQVAGEMAYTAKEPSRQRTLVGKAT